MRATTSEQNHNTPPDEIYAKVDWCVQKIQKLEEKMNHIRPWYTSVGIWFSILLITAMFMFIYILYLNDMGWTILVPQWMK